MRVALAIAVLLVAAPAQAKPWQCVLWPKSCEVPVPVPASPAPPLSQPAPIQQHRTVAVPPRIAPAAPQHKHVAVRKRIKSNFVKPKRKARVLPWWCSRIPAGTTMDRVEGSASMFIGRPLSDSERQQAKDCLASKSAP